MPNVPTIVALEIGDLHLSLTAPACRADKDWMATQAFYLGQVRKLADRYDVPILCAGDIFDRWNPPPELINFALKHLPEKMWCVPGQHDLPNHSLEEKHRSGYGVLAEAGKIIDLSNPKLRWTGNALVNVYGFGWGQKLVAPALKNHKLNVMLAHRYVWSGKAKYPEAPEESSVNHLPILAEYDAAFFGDNHKQFFARIGGCSVFNSGTFIRRKSDEKDHTPAVGLLADNGSIAKEYLDVQIDEFHDTVEDRDEQAIDMSGFISELNKLGEHGLDFREAVKNHLRREEIHPATKEIILKAMEPYASD